MRLAFSRHYNGTKNIIFWILSAFTSWPSILTYVFLFIFFCQSSSKFDDRVSIIVKSMDDYFCQNYILTCFFRQRYHREPVDKCKSLLILHSCLYYDTDLIRMCDQLKLIRARKNLSDQTPTYCFTSSIYQTFSAQHLRSFTMPGLALNYPLVVFLLLLIVFITRIRTCC